MNLPEEGAVEVDAGLDVDVVEVDSIGIQATMRALLETTMASLEGTGHLKKVIQENPMKSVAMVDLVVASVVVAVVSVMERM